MVTWNSHKLSFTVCMNVFIMAISYELIIILVNPKNIPKFAPLKINNLIFHQINHLTNANKNQITEKR